MRVEKGVREEKERESRERKSMQVEKGFRFPFVARFFDCHVSPD